MKELITTYEPDNSLRKGYINIFKEIVKETIHNRWLTWQLFRRNFFTMYKQSLAGLAWIFLSPIINITIFVLLRKAGIFNIGEIDVPYPIYALLGTAFWELFKNGLSSCITSIASAGSMIIKINFSKKSLVFSSIGKPIVTFFIQITSVLFLFIIFQTAPSFSILLTPFLILPIIIFTIGLGFLLSLINAVIRDVDNLISVFMTFLLFLTPILYQKPTEGLLAQLTKYNPIYYLVTAPREFILTGTMNEWRGYAIASALAIVIFIMSIIIFHLTETRISERM